MGVLQIIECKGFSKEEAFAKLKFNPLHPIIPGPNVTCAWKKAGKPVPGTQKFKRFITEILDKKTKNMPGYGVYITLEPGRKDTRKCPFTIISNKPGGIRVWNTVYQIREDELEVNTVKQNNYDDEGNEIEEENLEISITKPGLIVDTCASKSEALKKMKKLIAANHRCYSMIPIKVPNLAPIAAFGIYNPSINAKEGTFVACGINNEEI